MSWPRSRSRRPLTLPSMRRSPMRTTTPPSSEPSTWVVISTGPPATSSRRVPERPERASGRAGAALVTTARTMPARRSRRRWNSLEICGRSWMRRRWSSRSSRLREGDRQLNGRNRRHEVATRRGVHRRAVGDATTRARRTADAMPRTPSSTRRGRRPAARCS